MKKEVRVREEDSSGLGARVRSLRGMEGGGFLLTAVYSALLAGAGYQVRRLARGHVMKLS